MIHPIEMPASFELWPDGEPEELEEIFVVVSQDRRGKSHITITPGARLTEAEGLAQKLADRNGWTAEVRGYRLDACYSRKQPHAVESVERTRPAAGAPELVRAAPVAPPGNPPGMLAGEPIKLSTQLLRSTKLAKPGKHSKHTKNGKLAT